ncbi:MAG: hypothetical protein ACHQUA_01240 [Microgenomates group bacterium]
MSLMRYRFSTPRRYLQYESKANSSLEVIFCQTNFEPLFFLTPYSYCAKFADMVEHTNSHEGEQELTLQNLIDFADEYLKEATEDLNSAHNASRNVGALRRILKPDLHSTLKKITEDSITRESEAAYVDREFSSARLVDYYRQEDGSWFLTILNKRGYTHVGESEKGKYFYRNGNPEGLNWNELHDKIRPFKNFMTEFTGHKTSVHLQLK